MFHFTALQIDLSRHALENVRLVENAHDGLGIVYSDIFATGTANTVRNCEFSNNQGSGVGFKQVGIKIIGGYKISIVLNTRFVKYVYWPDTWKK